MIQPDPNAFPDGMKAVADYVHSKGLLFGVRGPFFLVDHVWLCPPPRPVDTFLVDAGGSTFVSAVALM